MAEQPIDLSKLRQDDQNIDKRKSDDEVLEALRDAFQDRVNGR